MKTIYILDAVNVLFRSYFAIGSMTNPKGESTNALYGFIRSVNKLRKDFAPDYFVAVFDGPESTKQRKELYSDYKIHRKKMAEDLFLQLERSLEFCEYAGIPYLAIPGYEADDVMGSIADWAKDKECKIYLCTSDKDLCQLVSENIFVLNPYKENLVIDQKKVKELFGVEPTQMVDLLAMTGDPSDNIPGIEGIGPKTASQLLQEYDSLDEIFAKIDQITGKKRELIEKGKEKALLSRHLAKIHLGVDFPKNISFFQIKEFDRDKLTAFYRDMHFMSLLKELGEEKTSSNFGIVESSSISPSYHIIDDEEELKKWISIWSKEKEICVDTETTDLNPIEAQIVGIGIGTEIGKAWYIPFHGKLGKERAHDLLLPFFSNPKLHFFGHNIKYDLHVLENVGIKLANISFDTIIASYLLNPQKRRHSLDELCLEIFGKIKTPISDLIGKGKNEISMRDVPIGKVAHYCCEDVDYTFRLKKLFEKELEKADLLPVFEQIEMPLIPVLISMERRGVYLDTQKTGLLSQELSLQIKQLQEEIFSLSNESFNLNSPKQLGEILFDKMQIRPLKRTQTGYATGSEILEELKTAHPIIEKIIDYRLIEKLRSTYVDALPSQISSKTG
ncbi:MAG: DNA polymerase, partial [Chlamydiae bacterium]|nr:DNA polymerase [Chlamydiota bacterium]